MALLDEQREAMENGTAAEDTGADAEFNSDDGAAAAPGFASAAASSFGGFGAASSLPVDRDAERPSSPNGGSNGAEDSASAPASPLTDQKRKMLSQIPEECGTLSDSLSGTQLASQAIPASQLSQNFLHSVRPLPPPHMTTHAMPVPLESSQEDFWPGLPTPAPKAVEVAAATPVQPTSSSPMPALVTPSPAAFTTPLTAASVAHTSIDSTAPTQAAKRARLSSEAELTSASSSPISSAMAAGLPPPSPIPIPSFLPSPAASPARAVATAVPMTPASAPRVISSPGSSGSQIIIPATPSLESQQLPSLESQFDAVAAEEEAGGGASVDASKAPLEAVPPAPVVARTRTPRDPYLPPSPEDVLPVLGSPAALRALVSSRVATFGGPAPPPACSVHHVLFALKDVLAVAAGVAGGGVLQAAETGVSRARLWQRTEQLLVDEFAEGEVARVWPADKRDAFAKIKPLWAQQFEQSLAELHQQGKVLHEPQLQRITLLASYARAPDG